MKPLAEAENGIQSTVFVKNYFVYILDTNRMAYQALSWNSNYIGISLIIESETHKKADKTKWWNLDFSNENHLFPC